MGGPESLLGAGCALLALGALAALLGHRPALACGALGSAALGAAGVAAALGADPVGAGFGDELRPRLGLDGLSGYFLALPALVAVPCLAYAGGYLDGRPRARALAALSNLFVLALAAVLCARDPLTLLAAWEAMTLLPATAILVRDPGPGPRQVVFVYLAVTHLGGAGVWVSVLALASLGALSQPSAFADAGAATQAAVWAAALAGFGTKAGLAPLHAWLPRAHPVAPGHISALMSAAMVKVALYGLIRVLFEWAAPAPAPVGYALLGLGLLSALAGVLYALFQRDLKRLLAFSTIENVGLIAVGLGAALLLAGAGREPWAALAFAAALLHALNHAAFKALLFLVAATVERRAGGLDLGRLGGLARAMPWTAAALALGALAIAGVPPLNGFASEWLTLQVLIHTAFGAGAGLALVAVAAAPGVAAAAALALACFVKVSGLSPLGAPRSAAAAAAREPGGGMLAAPLALAALCLALGAVPGLLLPTLAGLGPWGVELAARPGIELPGTGSLPAPWLAPALALATAGLWALRGRRRAAPSPTWACGQEAEPALAWTDAAAAKPVALVFARVLRPRRRVEVEGEPPAVGALAYAGEVPHRFDSGLYRPLRRRALRLAAAARRLQSGSLRAYAAYLLGLLGVLLVLLQSGALR